MWPEPHVAWLGLTLLGAYVVWFGARDDMGRAGAAVVLSMTVAMLWAKVVVHFCSLDLAEFDTLLVGLFGNIGSHGNIMLYQNDEGRLIVGWPCTSFANLSLAMMLWLTITRAVRPVPRRSEWWGVIGVTVSLIAINTLRLFLMTFSHDARMLVHDGWPKTAFNFALLLVTCAWALYGVRKELRL